MSGWDELADALRDLREQAEQLREEVAAQNEVTRARAEISNREGTRVLADYLASQLGRPGDSPSTEQ